MGSPALKSYPLIRTHSIRTRLRCEDLSAGHTGLSDGSTSANGRSHSACSILTQQWPGKPPAGHPAHSVPDTGVPVILPTPG